MNDKIGKRTYSALKNLYLNSIDMQNAAAKIGIRTRNSPLSFVKEYCTVKMSSARGSGHSTAIARFVNEFYNKNWVVLGYTQHQIDHLRELVRYEAFTNKKANITKITQSYIDFQQKDVDSEPYTTHFMSFGCLDKLRGIEMDGIIVDLAFMLSSNKIDEIYELGTAAMSTHRHNTFIFIE